MAFNILKNAITIVLVLISLNTFTLFYIKINSLDFTTETILFQDLKKDNKSFSPIKYNYKIYDKCQSCEY